MTDTAHVVQTFTQCFPKINLTTINLMCKRNWPQKWWQKQVLLQEGESTLAVIRLFYPWILDTCAGQHQPKINNSKWICLKKSFLHLYLMNEGKKCLATWDNFYIIRNLILGFEDLSSLKLDMVYLNSWKGHVVYFWFTTKKLGYFIW